MELEGRFKKNEWVQICYRDSKENNLYTTRKIPFSVKFSASWLKLNWK